MTHPPLATIAKRAFYDAMKAGGESEAMWIAAADAVAEECAKVADRRAERAKARDTASEDFAAHAALDIARDIRVMKGEVK